MNNKKKTLFRGRYLFLLCCMAAGFAALIWRMVDLAVVDRAFLKRQGDARTLRVALIPAYRGMITDKHGEPLAISTPVDSIWINPQDFAKNDSHLKKLADLLGYNVKELQQRLSQNKQRAFLYLKRGVNPHISQQIQALKIPGVYAQREFKRFYPEGEVMAHVLGFTDVDDRGQEGLELAYDNVLHGQHGKRRVIRDNLGHIVASVDRLVEPVPGNNVVLTLDRRIQYLAYRELKLAVKEHNAVSGTAIVLDAKNGDILAMVNAPSFNPNAERRAPASHTRNSAVTDVFEPGSLIKAFSVSTALMAGVITPESQFDTTPGYMMLEGHRIRDVHHGGLLTVKDVIKFSSNIGVTKIMMSMSNPHLVEFIKSLGFGKLTTVNFPGERSGYVNARADKNPFLLATLAFGYGMNTTPLQLTQAFTVFANNGKLVPVHLVKNQSYEEPRQILTPKVTKQMLSILTSVVEEKLGSGHLAKIDGFTVAGKTGTVRMVGARGYDADRHIGSFIGLVPATDPKLIILVVITDPKNNAYYGGSVAAPVFAKIGQGALRILNILPQELVSTIGGMHGEALS